MSLSRKLTTDQRRRLRVRNAVKASGRVRLSVHRSGAHIYAQIIDDAQGRTLAAASTIDKELKTSVKNGGNVAAATQVGALVAKRAVKAGVAEVVFDRGSYAYHGRVKALAEAAREAGLQF